MNLTPEQALADIRAVLMDKMDLHWLQCAAVLADELESLRDETAKLRAELDAIKTEPDANPAPALSRFLPSRPADVPAPPDGWVYVGRGAEVVSYNDYSPAISQLSLTKSWMIDSQGYSGTATREHYAIRWTAEPDIWHRFNLLAPSEGGGWIPHRPGDAIPWRGPISRLRNDLGGIIGWRPALAEVAT